MSTNYGGYQYGQPQQPPVPDEREVLAAQRKAAWMSYQSMQCAPGWQQRSIDGAAEAARAQYALDKANGYIRH